MKMRMRKEKMGLFLTIFYFLYFMLYTFLSVVSCRW